MQTHNKRAQKTTDASRQKQKNGKRDKVGLSDPRTETVHYRFVRLQRITDA